MEEGTWNIDKRKEESDTYGPQLGSSLDIWNQEIAPEIQELQQDITNIYLGSGYHGFIGTFESALPAVCQNNLFWNIFFIVPTGNPKRGVQNDPVT